MNAVLKPLPIQFSRETLAEARPDSQPLLEKHWREIAHYQDITLSVRWSFYEAAEEADVLRVFTARKNGELIGYAVFFVDVNKHYQESLQAVQDVLFVLPEHRNGRFGFRLIAYADQQLKAEGVQAVYQHSKSAHDIGPLLERMGYERVDIIYAKRLDK